MDSEPLSDLPFDPISIDRAPGESATDDQSEARLLGRALASQGP